MIYVIYLPSIQYHPLFMNPVKFIIALLTKSWSNRITLLVVAYHSPSVILFNSIIVRINLKKSKVTARYSKITTSLFQIYFVSWNEYCSSIYNPSSKEILVPAKESSPKLVHKYYSSFTDLLKLKEKCFFRKIHQYRKWSATELLKWIRIVRGIIRQYTQSKTMLLNWDWQILNNINSLKHYAIDLPYYYFANTIRNYIKNGRLPNFLYFLNQLP